MAPVLTDLRRHPAFIIDGRKEYMG